MPWLQRKVFMKRKNDVLGSLQRKYNINNYKFTGTIRSYIWQWQGVTLTMASSGDQAHSSYNLHAIFR